MHKLNFQFSQLKSRSLKWTFYDDVFATNEVIANSAFLIGQETFLRNDWVIHWRTDSQTLSLPPQI